MKQRDWLIVGIRLLGVWQLIQAIDSYNTVIDIYLGLFSPSRTPVQSYWIVAVRQTLLGLFLLIFAQVIVGLIYRKPLSEGGAKSRDGQDEI